MGASTAHRRANDLEAAPCPQSGCEGSLSALYHLTVSAPFPFSGVGFSKEAIKSRRVGIVACNWDTETVFCARCGWHPQNEGAARRSEIIMRLMRELVLRGMKPSALQELVGSAVSTIDVLAASYPAPSSP